MALTEDERGRVASALEAGPWSDTMARKLADLKLPEELHQFALNYNVNDSLNPIRFIIRSALCDKGTALYAYWLFDEIILTPPERQGPPEPDEEWNAAALVAEIEERFTTGFYTRQEIAFDPREELGWNEEDERRFKAREFTFPGEMLQVTPGRPVDRERI
jgi:hypothetical protein